MPTNYETQIASLNPKVWFKLDGTGTPTNSGSDTQTLSTTGTPVASQVGVSNNSYYFGGSAGYSSTSALTAGTLSDKIFTLEAWFQIAAADIAASGSNYHTIMRFSNGSQELGFRIKGASESSGEQGKIQCYIVGGSGYSVPILVSPNTYHDGGWHHMVLKADGTSLFLFVDGAQVATTSMGSMPTSLNLDGTGTTKSYGFATSEGFKGYIDEIAIYGEALSNAQILANYNSSGNSSFQTRIRSLATQPKWWFNADYSATKLTNVGTFGQPISANRVGPAAGAVLTPGGASNKFINFPNGNNASTGQVYFNIDPTSSDDSAAIFGHSQNWTFEFLFKIGQVYSNSNPFTIFRVGSSGSEEMKAFVSPPYAANPGKLTWYMTGVSTNLSLGSTNRLDDNAWHHVAVVHTANSKTELFVDGTLNQSLTHSSFGNQYKLFDRYSNISLGANSSALSTESFLGGIDDFLIYDYALSAAQVAGNYTSTIPSVNISYTAEVMTASNANLPMPVISAQRNVAYSDTASTASALAVDPTVSVIRNIDINGGGVSTASALSVDPAISVIRNINYSDTASTASATSPNATVSATKSINYSAAPATSSALFSSNVFFGKSDQDTSYTLDIRRVFSANSNNTSGNSGFNIGTQSSGDPDTIVSKDAVVIKAASGFPAYNKLIKVRFDSAHVTATALGGDNTENTFNIYVLTANPTSGTFTTAPYSSFTPVRELLYTTRYRDDSSVNQAYLDLTAAFADSRSASYGIMIEHVHTETSGSGDVYDRTEYTGSNLNHHLLYVLSSDIVSKNINADIVTASGLFVDPVITTTRTVNYSAAPATVTAESVMPVVAATVDATISANASTASALAVQPTFFRTVQYSAPASTAFGTTVNPTWYAQGTVTYNATVATASADLHMPQFNIGDGHSADHMNASATMPHGQVTLSKTVSADPMTASATSVTASTLSALNASIRPEAMTANQAKIVTPPAYSLPTDDPWYNRLTLQHSYKHGERFRTTNLAGDAGTSSAAAFLKLWTQPATTTNITSANVGTEVVTNLVSAEAYYDGQIVSGNAPGLKPFGTSSTAVSPSRIQAGFYDTYGRKSVKIQNTELGLAEQSYVSDRGYSLEFSIKTTKQNQIIAKGIKTSYYYYSSSISGIGLKDGKLYGGTWDNQFTNPFPETAAKGVLGQTLYGSKNVADGEWHHIVIQFGYNDARVQFWVDGELDVQSIPGNLRGSLGPKVRPFIIGHGSSDLEYYSDFETSVWSYDAANFVLQRELLLNYYSFIKYAPVLAEPMTASVDATQGATAKGNRTRALCLYWWPTNLEGGFVGATYTGVSWMYPLGGHSYDQGKGGEHDYDTGYPFTTWDLKESGPQRWYDMDVFPVDISGYYVSEVVKPEAYGGADQIQVTQIPTIDTYPISLPASRTYLTSKAGSFRKPKTDSRRYIDVLNDIDLSQFDVILFRNFPDESRELDEFTKNEFTDSYFGVVERELYEEFVVNLRKAVDTGISLHISNRQLAIDLGIIDRVEPVDSLIDNLAGASDPHAPTIVPEDALSLDTTPGTNYGWADTFWNNKFRVRNTLEDLTDLPQNIVTEYAFWQNDGLRDFSGSDRNFSKVVDRPNGLQVGDEMIAKDIPINGKAKSARFLGVPMANVKAGIPITTFGQKYWRGNEELDNPYKDYVTTIAVRPGDVLNGTQCGGKIFVNLAERPQATLDSYCAIDLKTDYWINKAYNQGAISLTKRNTLLTQSHDRKLESGEWTQAQYDRNASWTHNDMALTGQLIQGNTGEQGFGDQFIGNSANSKIAYNVSKKGQSQSLSAQLANLFSAGQAWFTVQFSYATEYVVGYSPSMNTMSMNWLANRVIAEGNVNRPTAFESSATLVMPTVNVVKVNSVTVSAMIAGANSPDGQYRGPSRVVAAFPMEASVKFGEMVKLVKADPMLARTILPINTQVITTSKDEVVLYVMHEDPVLYIREDLIK
jgi:hypothetical protein